MKTWRLHASATRAWAKLGSALAVAAIASAATQACHPARKRAERSPAADEPAPRALTKIALAVPSDDTIPGGPEGELVRRGRRIATRTFEEVPDLASAELHCSSCHLDAGTRAAAGPWVGLSRAFPERRAREGRVVTLEERIDSCFERSLNGKAPPHDGPVMRSLVAYIDWLSRDVPPGSEVVGRGFPKLERPPNVDADVGKNGYLARCASCHGEDAQGRRAPDGGYRYPPLAGPRSFNLGAGMGRLDTAAAFVKHDMPLGQPESLTTIDAYDIAAYFTELSRPDFAKKHEDWPHGGKPSDARY